MPLSTDEAPSFEVVLHQPQIPPNTGNVARMCACTGSRLHLVAPLGFSIDDARLKRAGLDYWHQVFVRTWESVDEIFLALSDRPIHLFTAGAPRSLWDVTLRPGDLLVFGSESQGLPDALLSRFPDRQVAIPMVPGRRSLNLSAAAAVAVYEGLRQNLGRDS